MAGDTAEAAAASAVRSQTHSRIGEPEAEVPAPNSPGAPAPRQDEPVEKDMPEDHDVTEESGAEGPMAEESGALALSKAPKLRPRSPSTSTRSWFLVLTTTRRRMLLRTRTGRKRRRRTRRPRSAWTSGCGTARRRRSLPYDLVASSRDAKARALPAVVGERSAL